MELLYSATSPYARKVRVVLREKGLIDTTTETVVDPHAGPPALRRHNPLGKVPTLVLADATALYDTPVICEYLDTLADAPRLLPAGGPERWAVLRAQALADGILDLAVALTAERRRPDGERSPAIMDHWRERIRAAADGIAAELDGLPPEPTLAHIALAVALAYLDFRHPDLRWRDGRVALTDWHECFTPRASMRATAPPDT